MFVFKILFLLFTWFTNLAYAVPIFSEFALPNYAISLTKTESQKLASEVKIGVENFARSSIEELQKQNSILHNNTFSLSSILKEENSCALNFQNAGTRNEVTVAQSSKEERLNELENRAREILQGYVNGAGSIVNSADELASFVIQNGIRNDIDLNFVILMTNGRRDLIEGILLSTKEVIDGQSIQQLITHFNITNIPSVNSLSNYQTRIWYHFKKSNIPNLIDNNVSLENQALQAFNLRNQYRAQARNFMSDRSLAVFLEANEQNLDWSNYVNYLQTSKGLSGDAAWNYIINSATTGRDGVDALFKL